MPNANYAIIIIFLLNLITLTSNYWGKKMKDIYISEFQSTMQANVSAFFVEAFEQNCRKLDFTAKDKDLTNIEENYCKEGRFWCLLHNNKVVGTIAIRKLSDCYEIRRFFILQSYQGLGFGKRLLFKVLQFAFYHDIRTIKAATMYDGHVVAYLMNKFGFIPTTRYNNSSADLFWMCELTKEKFFGLSLNYVNNNIKSDLILNPTENFFMQENYETKLLEGLYVSERQKSKEDIVIFGGRADAIDLYHLTKQVWRKALNAQDVDLKTHSGLNAHLILFLSIAKRGEKVLLLPEAAGGHFSTEAMLKKIGLQVFHFAIDNSNFCIDVNESKKIIEREKPHYIFVDRSEGLVYEDFSWLGEYDNVIKIFDGSQYLTQIICGYYPNPLLNGFDYFISSLHKNYPGAQKSVIATNAINDLWNEFLRESKTFISNNHPEGIIKSAIPLIQFDDLKKYSDECIRLCEQLNDALCRNGVPVIKKPTGCLPAPHIWILPKNQEAAYALFSLLEEMGINVNYRKLPYNLNFGLRLGVNAAVRQGLQEKHVDDLASIIAAAYFNDGNMLELIKKSRVFLKTVIAK